MPTSSYELKGHSLSRLSLVHFSFNIFEGKKGADTCARGTPGRSQRHSAQDIIRVRSSQMTRISSWTSKLLKLLTFLSDDLPDLFKYWSAVCHSSNWLCDCDVDCGDYQNEGYETAALYSAINFVASRARW